VLSLEALTVVIAVELEEIAELTGVVVVFIIESIIELLEVELVEETALKDEEDTAFVVVNEEILTVGGTSTASIRWITPFEAEISVLVTVAESLIVVVFPVVLILIVEDSTVFDVVRVTIFDALTVPEITWYLRILDSVSLFSGLRRLASTPAGSLLKASLVGARTVNGPLSDKVSVKSAALMALTRVDRVASELAVPTMLVCAEALIFVTRVKVRIEAEIVLRKFI
jgi:hypothetical protein